MKSNRFLTRKSLVVLWIALQCAWIAVIAQKDRASTPSPDADQEATVRADLAFDVVSIRPSNAADNEWSMSVVPGGDEFHSIGMPLGRTILLAYFPFRLQSKERIVGAPSWVWNDRYDFIGKVGDADLPNWHQFSQRGFMTKNPVLQIMLQNALADRCKMAVHRVPAQIDGYALVVASHGPSRKNLIESKPDDVIPARAIKLSLDGRMVPIYSEDDPVLHFYQTSMSSLVLMLSGFGGAVEDRTGLTGKYRFDLTRLGTEGILTSDWDFAPLGLKLIRAKIPIENIVIDHIERPTPN